MKRVSALLASLLVFAVVLPAQADGRGYGGHGGGARHGGHGFSQTYGGHAYSNHYRGSSDHWLAPVLGAALVGGVIYAASTPSYAGSVVIQQPYPAPSRVAYFCPTVQQYYPNVATCQVPWQLVSY